MKITALALLSRVTPFPFITFLQKKKKGEGKEERGKDSKVWEEGGRKDVNLNNFQKEHGKIPAVSFKNQKIFHLTVLALRGGSLGTDHNVGMPNPLSSTISHKGSICPSEEGDSADIKAWRGSVACLYQHCPGPYYSLHIAVSLNKTRFLKRTAVHSRWPWCCSAPACVWGSVCLCARGRCAVEMTLLSFYRGFHSARARALYRGSLCWYLS